MIGVEQDDDRIERKKRIYNDVPERNPTRLPSDIERRKRIYNDVLERNPTRLPSYIDVNERSRIKS